MKKSAYLFLLLLFVLSACENEIPYRMDTVEPKLIMNALLEADANQNIVYLNLSGSTGVKNITEGSVTLYVNGEEKEVVVAESEAWWDEDYRKICILKTRFHPGDVLRLEAFAEHGKYYSWAEVTVPYPVESIKTDTLFTEMKINNFIQSCLQYKITFDDIPGQHNYYRLQMKSGESRGDLPIPPDYLPDRYYYIDNIINWEDVVLTDGHIMTDDDNNYNIFDLSIQNKYNVFTDRLFEDASYTLKVYVPHGFFNDNWSEFYRATWTVICLMSINEADYRYYRAMNCLESDNYDEMFMEPVIVPNNVEEGYGFVGASSACTDTMRVFYAPPSW